MVLTAAALVCMLGAAQVPAEERPRDALGLTLVKSDARELQRRGDYVSAARLLERFSARLDDVQHHDVKREAERVAARYHALSTSFVRAQRDPRACALLFTRVLLAGHRFVPLTREDAERALLLLEEARPGIAAVVVRQLGNGAQLASSGRPEPERSRARRLLEAALRVVERDRL